LRKLGVALVLFIVVLAILWRISKLTSFQVAGRLVDRVETKERLIALTFDDGPSVENTRAILDVLDRYAARATFFMVGARIEAHPEIAGDVHRRGHEVGNHSYAHARMILRTPSFMRQEIERTDALLRRMGVEGDIHFRPPYGKKLFVLPWVLAKLHKTTIMWDVESSDTGTQDRGALTSVVLSGARPGSIVLFHDGGAAKPGTIAALEAALRELKARGYRFVTVSELISRAAP
jgi:peptidoglycan/xylan/chitin deacetylase (PgdA/CDA1 family)